MKGIVMDIKDGKAVVFQKNGNVVKVRDNGYQVGQKINISTYRYKNYIAVAACLVLVFITGISGYAVAYRTPSGYVYVDINPSMRLDMNCFNKVISVVPLNDDAETLSNGNTLKSSDVEMCIDEIVTACREQNYLSSDNNRVELNVVTKKKKLSDKVESVSKKLSDDNLNVVVGQINETENKKAMKYKTSPKRLRAVDLYTKAFGGTTEENFAALKGVTNREIYEKLRAAGFTGGTDGETNHEPRAYGKKDKPMPRRTGVEHNMA